MKSFDILVGTTLRDNPKTDAYGPMARDMKINTLRTYVIIFFFILNYFHMINLFRRAIQVLGESTFEKVYDYFVKQRTLQKTDPNLDDGKISQGLASFVKKPSDCFLVDQLVFLEMIQ